MSLFAPRLESLRDLYVNELRDLYSAENQLVDALPKMAAAAHSPELTTAFESHLRQTENHVRRLEEIFAALDQKPSGETCQAMQGLIRETNDYVRAGGDEDVRDAGLIGAAQRVEHYEIAGYGTARSLATTLGDARAGELLQQTLDEEGAADKTLTSLAESGINAAAAAAR